MNEGMNRVTRSVSCRLVEGKRGGPPQALRYTAPCCLCRAGLAVGRGVSVGCGSWSPSAALPAPDSALTTEHVSLCPCFRSCSFGSTMGCLPCVLYSSLCSSAVAFLRRNDAPVGATATRWNEHTGGKQSGHAFLPSDAKRDV